MTWKASDYFESIGSGHHPEMRQTSFVNMTCTLYGFTFAMISEPRPDPWMQQEVSHRATGEHLGMWHRDEIMAEQRMHISV